MASPPTLQAGSFNRRLVLQDEVETADGCGGFTTNWVPLSTLWARIVPVSGSAVYRADNLDHEVSHAIFLRKQTTVKQGMRFIEGQRKFRVISVFDPDETGRYLKCDVREESQ